MIPIQHKRPMFENTGVLVEADTARLEAAFKAGNSVAKDILESYAQAEFFTKLPDIDEEIELVTMIAAEGDISTDLLSPGAEAHSRSDRELHGRCMCTPEDQQLIVKLQKENPGKKVMMIAEKGTMGVALLVCLASTTLRCGPVSKPVLMCPLLTTHPS